MIIKNNTKIMILPRKYSSNSNCAKENVVAKELLLFYKIIHKKIIQLNQTKNNMTLTHHKYLYNFYKKERFI